MVKKIMIASLLSTLFVACDFPGDAIKNKNTEKDKKDKNLTSGEGTKNKPYIISANKFYGTNNRDTTYYEFELKNTNNECQMIIYSRDNSDNDYVLSAKEPATYHKNNILYDMYTSFKLMNDGKYTLSTKAKDNDFRFGIYSPCFTHSETIDTISEKEQSFKKYQKLYTFKLNETKKVKINDLSNISSVIIFNSKFEKIESIYNLTNFEKEFKKDKYYILLKGTKSDDFTKFTLEIIN